MNEAAVDPISTCTTLVDVLHLCAASRPEQPAYTFLVDGESQVVEITYQELLKKVRAIATLLQEKEMRGERALLLHPPGLDYIIAFLACLYAGVVAVPAYPPRLNRNMLRLQAIIQDARAKTILATASTFESIAGWGKHTEEESAVLQDVQWIPTDTITLERADTCQRVPLTGETLAFLQYTSGSTSAPKGVMVSHANLLYNSGLLYRYYEHSPSSVMVS